MGDPDPSEQAPGPRKSRRTYSRGGRVSDMMRLLERSETQPESRRVWPLVVAGIAIAVAVVAALRFFSG